MLSAGTLSGKVAIVTGGGTGIGKAISSELARIGAHVVLAARNLERLEEHAKSIRAGGGKASSVQVDVRSPEAVEAMVSKAEEMAGPVNILVNNASGNFPVAAEKLTPNGWRAVLGIVMDGSWFCTQALAKRWIARGSGGKVVNMVTPLAWRGNPGTVHSAAAKAGVIAMTKTLAVEWAPYNIQLNGVAPGLVPTEQSTERIFGTDDDIKALLARIPAGRFGNEQEMAWAVSYLVSPYADFISGATLVLDGAESLEKGTFRIPTAKVD